MGSGTSSISASEEANIVIVGGGYGGTTLGCRLKSSGKMKIINPYEFQFHNIGALRAVVEPSFTKNLMIPLQTTFGDSFVKGRVVQINKEGNSVTLESGEEVKYSHLVLATGASSSFPSKLSNDYPQATNEDTTKLYEDINKQVQEADTIVCVGGGAVGVELAGELKTDYPNKKIMLIHTNETLISSRMNAKVQKALQKTVRGKGIELMLGERVANLADLEFNKCIKQQVVKTESGKEINCDLVFRCIGIKINTEQFRSSLGDAIASNGVVKVDQYLRVEGTENIFALGDITNVEEEKMCMTAMAHAEIIAKNIEASFAGKKLQPYKPGSFAMVIPVGRDGGISQLFGMTLGNLATRNIKSEGLFVSRFWGAMHQKPPK